MVSISIPNPVTPHAPTYSTFQSSDPLGITFGSPTYFTSKQSFWKITWKERKILRRATGMYWTDMRKIWWAAMISPRRDSALIRLIKELINPFPAVRSGRLMDTIKKTMRIRRESWYRSHFWVIFSFTWPYQRPFPIGGNVRHNGETGYGELYFPTESVPNRTLLRVTGGGNGLYLLQDPTALNNPINDIRDKAHEILFNDVYEIFNNMVITYIA